MIRLPRTKYKYSIIFIIFLLSLSLCNCADKNRDGNIDYSSKEIVINNNEDYNAALKILEKDYSNINLYKKIWLYTVENNLTDSLIKGYHNILKSNPDDNIAAIYANAYLAQIYLFNEQYDKCKPYLQEGMDNLIYKSDDDQFIEGTLYNFSAIYAMKKDYNYVEALDFLNKAIIVALNNNDMNSLCIYLCNITNIYCIRKDTTGIKYAETVYRISSKLNNINTQSMGAFCLANIYYLKEDYKNAKKYADIAIKNIDRPDFQSNYKAEMYMFEANIFDAVGDETQAKQYFQLSIDNAEYAEKSITTKIYCTYGNFLLKHKKYEEAIKYFLNAKTIYESNNNIEFQYQILYGLSTAYKELGDDKLSLDYLSKSHEAFKQIHTFQKEEDFSNLKLKYEQAKFNAKINKKELELLKKNNRLTTIVFISIIIALLLIYFYILYIKQNHMYRNIVQQNYNYRKKLEEYNNLNNLKNDKISKSKFELFEKIEKLMNDDKIYRRKDLTVENLAELIGTNNTYVSNVINQLAGKTFPAYVNAYRMKEVLETLSDPENNDLINSIFENAGFSSRATYTRIFQKEIGCTPSQYREQIRKINS